MERSAEKVLFNTGFTTSASGGGGQQLQCSGKPVCGESIMWNHHESNQKSGQRVQKFIEQVHNAASRIASPRADSVFVGQCLSVVHCPPACVKWEEWWGKTLCPGWDTHTHSLSHSLTLSLSHSLTHSLTVTHSLSLTHCHSLTHSHSLSLTHSLTHSPPPPSPRSPPSSPPSPF